MSTFVVCHGAWSAGWAWKKVRPLLRATGHEIFTPTYTGLGERGHLVSRTVDLGTHIDDVLAVLHYEDLRDVILVGHSYGGMVATGVADRATDRIARLIYIDAFVPRSGQCLNDLLPAAAHIQRKALVEEKGDGWLLAPNPTTADTSAEDIAWVSSRRRWQPLGTFTQPLFLNNAKSDIPRSYIYCTRRTPDDRFGQFATRAQTELGWTYFEIDASHSPNVTAPEELVRILQQIAGS